MITIFWAFLGTVHCNLLRASGGFAFWIPPGFRHLYNIKHVYRFRYWRERESDKYHSLQRGAEQKTFNIKGRGHKKYHKFHVNSSDPPPPPPLAINNDQSLTAYNDLYN